MRKSHNNTHCPPTVLGKLIGLGVFMTHEKEENKMMTKKKRKKNNKL